MDKEFERIWKEKSVVITGSIRVLRGTEKNHEET
jgi:nitroimidazol reductase NimA-like FMN-containing flavoprotein (pyridoxamine 5'-phosphate oxidase superfamily)